MKAYDQIVSRAMESARMEAVHDVFRNNLYASRLVLNTGAIRQHYIEQGYPDDAFDNPAKWHVTIAYSKQPLDWGVIQPLHNVIELAEDERDHDAFGEEKNIHVLRISSRLLAARWGGLVEAGASWDYPDYAPHISIGRDPDIEWMSMTPYDGVVSLGPERFDIIRDDE